VGAGILVECLAEWEATAGPAFWIYLVASMVVAGMKVRLPGLPHTMSAGFLLLLAATLQLSRGEVVIIAGASAVVQCLWKPKRKASEVQVAFSAATLVLSAALAQAVSQELGSEVMKLSVVSQIVVAAFLLYTTNTLLVATVVSLVEGRAFRNVWQQCHLWAFPYFICGAILLDVAAAFHVTITWRESLLLLPLMLLLHVNYRILTNRIAEQGAAVAVELYGIIFLSATRPPTSLGCSR
jgi:hypothetical protein